MFRIGKSLISNWTKRDFQNSSNETSNLWKYEVMCYKNCKKVWKNEIKNEKVCESLLNFEKI